jgi:hypothetical protein
MRFSYPCRYRLSDTLAQLKGNNTMAIKTYGLAIEKPHALVTLKLPLMTLAQAESYRDVLASMGTPAYVVNLKAE